MSFARIVIGRLFHKFRCGYKPHLPRWGPLCKRLQPSLLEVTTTFKEDFRIPVKQSRLIVTSLGKYSGGGKLSENDVYQLHSLHAEELTREDIELRNRLIDRGGFSLKLINPTDVLVDHIGTLQDDKQTWQLHECLVDGVRSSLIRPFDASVPRSGTERRGWRRAIDAKRLVAGIYYGHLHDLGSQGTGVENLYLCNFRSSQHGLLRMRWLSSGQRNLS